MWSSKHAKMNVDGLKVVKVRKRMSVAGIPPWRPGTILKAKIAPQSVGSI
jgi:hypothetical protein